MAIDVIGAGYGRTGTLSFKLALEQLGFGPCYHMLEVFGRPDHVRMWGAAAEGVEPDWHKMFVDFRSTCDWPTCNYWAEQKAAWPNAKVVLTRRDPDAWYESMSHTILESLARDVPDDIDELIGAQMRATKKLIAEGVFGGRLDDRAHALAVLAAHEQEVIAGVPAAELLVYDVAEGWEPLCAFLGVDVPDGPFPRTNTTAEFRQMARLDRPPT